MCRIAQRLGEWCRAKTLLRTVLRPSLKKGIRSSITVHTLQNTREPTTSPEILRRRSGVCGCLIPDHFSTGYFWSPGPIGASDSDNTNSLPSFSSILTFFLAVIDFTEKTVFSCTCNLAELCTVNWFRGISAPTFTLFQDNNINIVIVKYNLHIILYLYDVFCVNVPDYLLILQSSFLLFHTVHHFFQQLRAVITINPSVIRLMSL